MLSKLATFCASWVASYAILHKLTLLHNHRILPAVISSIIAFTLYKQVFRYKGSRRRLSLFSQSMVNSFPPECQTPGTIINGCLYTDEPPTVTETLKIFNEKVIPKYYRFNSYVEQDADGYYVWQQCQPRLKMEDKLFIHYVSSDVEMHQLATKIIAIPFQHECNPIIYGKSSTVHGKSAAFEAHQIINTALVPKDTYDISALPSTNISPSLDFVPKEHTQCVLKDAEINTPQINNVNNSANATSHMTLVRVDHTIGDGIALFTIFGDIATDEKGTALLEKTRLEMEERKKKRKAEIAEANKRAYTPTSSMLSPWGLWNTFITAPLYKTYQYVTSFVSTASLAVGKYDTKLTYNQIPSNGKQVYKNTRNFVIVPTLSLDCIKNIKNAAGCTINDVLFCATSGALRRLQLYNQELGINNGKDPLIKKDQNSPERDLLARALLPLAFPRNLNDKSTGEINPDLVQSNKFTFLSANLLIHIADTKQRLHAINALTKELKTSPDAVVSFGVTKAGTWLLPAQQAQETARDLFQRHTLVFSNVPGPNKAFWGSKQIKGFHMVYPNIITQVGIISINNKIYMNFTLDTVEIINGHKLGQFMHDELVDMAKIYGVQWSEPDFA